MIVGRRHWRGLLSRTPGNTKTGLLGWPLHVPLQVLWLGGRDCFPSSWILGGQYTFLAQSFYHLRHDIKCGLMVVLIQTWFLYTPKIPGGFKIEEQSVCSVVSVMGGPNLTRFLPDIICLFSACVILWIRWGDVVFSIGKHNDIVAKVVHDGCIFGRHKRRGCLNSMML